MRLYVKKEQIIQGLQKAASIIASSSSGANYLRSIWLKAENNLLTIMSTDTVIEFTGTYTAEISEPGFAGVNGRTFVDLISRLPNGNIKLSLDDESDVLTIEQGRRIYHLPTGDKNWFHELAPFPAQNTVIWSGDFFKEIVDKTLFCVDDTGQISDALGCLHLRASKDAPAGNIDVCGLDGHQFAMMRMLHDELAAALPEEGILIQKKNIKGMIRLISDSDIELCFTEKYLFIRTTDGSEYISLCRKTGERYPEYSAFLERLKTPEATLLSIPRQEVIDALGRLSVFADNERYPAIFELSQNELKLDVSGQSLGSASEIIEVGYDGNLSKIAFPAHSIMEILTHYTSDTITLTLTGAEGPCGFKGDSDPDYIVLLMPMQISQQEYYSTEQA